MANSSPATIENSKLPKGSGFDAPVSTRGEDHLERWPLARQVYGVAVNGPEDWSARIGLYGEWGTGKTSVLRFVSSMAETDGHIVVWFDPWAYANKADLWRAFVLKLCDTAEEKLGGITKAGDIRRKSYFAKARDFLGKATKAAPGDYGTAASGGLELLRGAFSISSKDAQSLREDLKGHRVIILIDDLDRTAAELVPEILYSLKEVMDVPGFSFICGFDPKVVGEVLASKHPGFGDGLRFLEKIIDYPVWLPPPPAEGLKRMAEVDAAKYCPFIPQAALHDVLNLLPQNPRAIRQFVRITALLKSQTHRHGDDELSWPIILSANAIKVRFPKLDPALLHSHELYEGIGMRRVFESSTAEGDKVNREIADHVASCLKQTGIEDDREEAKTWLHEAIRRICQHLDLWMGNGVADVIYQATLAERPRALTKHEFRKLIPLWKNKKSAAEVGSWISEHCKSEGIQVSSVAADLIVFLVNHLKEHLRASEAAFKERERTSHRVAALKIAAFLENLVLRPSTFHQDMVIRDWLPLEFFVTEMVSLAEAKSPIHQLAWPKIEKMLFQLVQGWDARFESLLDAIRSIRRYGKIRVDGPSAAALSITLNDLVDDRLAKEFIRGIEEEGFIGRIAYQRGGTQETRRLITNSRSRLWQKYSGGVLAAFSKKKTTLAVQGNAYAFLEWIQYLLDDHGHGDADSGKAIAGVNDLLETVWRSATQKPFLGRHAHRISKLPSQVKKLGINLSIPIWWQPAIDEFLLTIDQKSGDKLPPEETVET